MSTLSEEQVREIAERAAKATPALCESHEQLRAERDAEREAKHDALSLLASATDLLNTWAREWSATEALRPEQIKVAIDSLWRRAALDVSKGHAELVDARGDIETLQARVKELEEAMRKVLTTGGRVDMSYRENRMAFRSAIAEAWNAISAPKGQGDAS